MTSARIRSLLATFVLSLLAAALVVYALPQFGLIGSFAATAAVIWLGMLLATLVPTQPKPPTAIIPKEVAANLPPLRESGLVKFFDTEKGFGFIVRSNGEDLFVHYRSLADENAPALVAGQTVQYHIGPGRKGPQAEDVTVLSQPS